MQTGFLVMYGVIAVVEQHSVQEPKKISRMIPLGLFIGVNVLHKIKNENAEKAYLLWDHHKEQCFFPIDDECHRDP